MAVTALPAYLAENIACFIVLRKALSAPESRGFVKIGKGKLFKRFALVVAVVEKVELRVIYIFERGKVDFAVFGSALVKKGEFLPVGAYSVEVFTTAVKSFYPARLAVLYPVHRRVGVFEQPLHYEFGYERGGDYFGKFDIKVFPCHSAPENFVVLGAEVQNFVQFVAVAEPYAVEVARYIPVRPENLFGMQAHYRETFFYGFKARDAARRASADVIDIVPERI